MCPRLHCHKSVCLPRGSVDRSTRYQYRFPLSASQFQPHSDFDFDSGSHSPHLQPHPHPNPHIHMCCPDIVIAFALRFSICADLCVVVMWFKGSVNHASCLILSRPRFPAYLPTQWNYFFVSSAPKSAPTPSPLQKKKFLHMIAPLRSLAAAHLQLYLQLNLHLHLQFDLRPKLHLYLSLPFHVNSLATSAVWGSSIEHNICRPHWVVSATYEKGFATEYLELSGPSRRQLVNLHAKTSLPNGSELQFRVGFGAGKQGKSQLGPIWTL